MELELARVTTIDDLGVLEAAPSMCLLHADFHVMRERCWGAVLEWQLSRPGNGMDPREHYQLMVERAMLDELFRQLATE